MDKLTEMQAEALKKAVEQKSRQFYAELNEILKSHNVTDLNNTKLSSSSQKDESLENKKEVENDGQNHWEMKILLTSKEISNKPPRKTLKLDRNLPSCRVVSFFPLVIECD